MGDMSPWTGFLMSLGQKGEGVHMIQRLFGPLIQKAVSFWVASIEGRVLASADFMVQLGTGSSFWPLLRLLPRALVLHPTSLKPSPALDTGGFAHLHRRGIAVEDEEGII